MTELVLLIITICLGAFALSAVDWLTARWVRLYTWLLPPKIRDRRREEIRSDLFEQRRREAAEGYKPVEIAVRMLLRWISGIPADVSWSAGGHLYFRRSRKITHDVEYPPVTEDQLRHLLIAQSSDRVTMIEDPEAVPIVVGTREYPGGYLVYGLPIVHDTRADEHSRWAAVQAQVRALWGDELVVAPPGASE